MKRWLLFLLLYVNAVWSQPGQIHFARVDISKGLSHNQINTIYRDSKGFVWLGTMSGLNRYDGYGFKIFRTITSDTNSISDNYIHRIYPFPGNRMLVNTRNGANIYDPKLERFERRYGALQSKLGLPDTIAEKVVADRQGDYWFVFAGKGLWKYGRNGKAAHYGLHEKAGFTIASDKVTDIAEGTDGLYLIHDNAFVEKIESATGAISSYPALQQMTAGNHTYSLFVASKGDCWISISNEAVGVYRLNPLTGIISFYNKQSSTLPLNSNIVTGIVEDEQRNIWIATDHGGVNLVNPSTNAISYLTNNAEDNRSISQNSTVSLYRDKEGIVWVGTYKQGFNYFNENVARFPLYKRLDNTSKSLSYEDVNRFVEDAKGNLWIGTNGGGLVYFDRTNNTFKQWLAGPGSISNNVIVSLCIDHDQKLWIGSYFGGLDCFDGSHFINYKHNVSDTNSISDDRVMEIFEDSKLNLWIGTLSGWVNRFDPIKKTFEHYTNQKPYSLTSGYISCFLEDKEANFWVGTAVGINIFKKNGGMEYLTNVPNNVQSISNNNVMSMLEDSKGQIWIGTREGLNVYEKRTKKIRRFTKENGLPDNTILNILEDDKKNIWVSTPNGLTQILVDQAAADISTMVLKFRNYNELNNLQGREFNEKAAFKTSNGELIFGGAFGFNIFKPEQIAGTKEQIAVVLTDFEVFNTPVKVGEKMNGNILLPQSIIDSKNISLTYAQNVFSIAFASLDFSHTEKDKYAYKLEGFNNDWLVTDGTQRRATFTNLDPGDYTFRVHSLNNDGSIGGNDAVLKITIFPPFWRTPIAYALYVLLFGAALWFARRLVLQRARGKFAIEQERQEAKRMHELDMMKIRFITNVSHEFRTPLSLIIAPADKLVRNATDAAQKKQYQLIHRNARRLLNLVNQLLDFRKLEVQEFRYNPTAADIVAFTKDISFSFTDIAEKKNIHFSFESNIDSQLMSFDADKLEKVLFNLLSNAYKFTPENGSVGVEVDAIETRLGSLENNNYFEIRVRDTGIGIPTEKLDKVFERFFQNEMPGNIINQGSGIGLAIAKEFVKLHNGTITVESELDNGSCFIVRLPFANAIEQASLTEQAIKEFPQSAHEATIQPAHKLHGKRATILIVEDNEDFRFYLKDNLGLHFHIVEAANGKEGWQQVQELQPDLVVTDVMMPVMNGLELAKKIKHDPRTSTIPVILLTARTAEEQQLEGLDTGANDYISKPFSFEILLSRIRNLLAQQKASKKATKQITVSTTDIGLESGDEKAIQLALETVEKNISNPDFSVEDLSRELLISRVGLYKKLLALTGKTPIEFIRDIRLERAKQLLEKSEMNVAEIAYEVGFNDPKYFAKTFKKEFGVLPSGWVQKMKEDL